MNKKFRILRFKKKSGGKRVVCAPSRGYKAHLRCLVPGLNQRVLAECDPAVVHGFVPGRSPVTNARAHIGKAFTLCMDLKDFFDRVRPEHVKLSPDERELVFAALKEGEPLAARQGFPTSPAVSNLAAAAMDAALVRLRDAIPAIVQAHGHAVNPKKTRLQSAAYGRRVVTGVAVSATGLHPTRSVRRRLRAALHQGNLRQADGLREWAQLRPPTGKVRLDSRVAKCVARHVARRLNGEPDEW